MRSHRLAMAVTLLLASLSACAGSEGNAQTKVSHEGGIYAYSDGDIKVVTGDVDSINLPAARFILRYEEAESCFYVEILRSDAREGQFSVPVWVGMDPNDSTRTVILDGVRGVETAGVMILDGMTFGGAPQGELDGLAEKFEEIGISLACGKATDLISIARAAVEEP